MHVKGHQIPHINVYYFALSNSTIFVFTENMPISHHC